jgi:hypothetical protein
MALCAHCQGGGALGRRLVLFGIVSLTCAPGGREQHLSRVRDQQGLGVGAYHAQLPWRSPQKYRPGSSWLLDPCLQRDSWNLVFKKLRLAVNFLTACAGCTTDILLLDASRRVRAAVWFQANIWSVR